MFVSIARSVETVSVCAPVLSEQDLINQFTGVPGSHVSPFTELL